jgi:hypothetical protein
VLGQTHGPQTCKSGGKTKKRQAPARVVAWARKAIGETAPAPLVVATRDLLACLRPMIPFRDATPEELPRFPDGQVPMWAAFQEQYTIASEIGWRIWNEDHDSVAVALVDRISVKLDIPHVLDCAYELPVYRNPGMTEPQIVQLMTEMGCDADYALSHPEMPGKRCSCCFYVRRRLHFSRNVTHADGKESRCRPCRGNRQAAEDLRTDEPEWVVQMWGLAG